MRLIDTNIRINAVAPGATVTPAHLANKAGEQPGGAKMLEYSKHFVYFPGPECDPIDQANACLFLASDMGKHVKGQVNTGLQWCFSVIRTVFRHESKLATKFEASAGSHYPDVSTGKV